jgi:hypothetical protein
MKRLNYLTPLGVCLVVTGLLSFAIAQAESSQSAPASVVSRKTFAKSGDAEITCLCILGSSGCSSDFFDKASGSQRVDWRQTVSVVAGKEVDLAAACYRKRDVNPGGKGLCCTPSMRKDGSPDPKEVERFFGATITKEP